MSTHKSFEGIRYYPDETGKGIFYYPDKPGPQMDSNGDPMISLIGAGSHWFIQLSTRWAVSDESLDNLVDYLLSEEKINAREELKQAPITVDKADLILLREDEEKVLASSKTSGHHPFTAAFNTTISEELQKDIAAAFNGKEDVLFVRYDARIEMESPIEMTLTGPIHTLRESLSIDSQDDEIRDCIDQNISENSFKIEGIIPEDISAEVIQKVQKNLIDQTVEEIKSYLNQEDRSPDESLLEVFRKERIDRSESIKSITDISDWFKNNSSDHIKIIK